MSEHKSESLTLSDLKGNSELLKKAEMLIEFRGYRVENISQTTSTIDIQASHPDSDETVMMHIVTKTDLKANAIGANTMTAIDQILEKPDMDKIIVFGNRFTESAQNVLRDEGIEFFSPTRNILSTLNPRELYSTIFKYVDALCLMKCGSTPQSSADCTGYTQEITPCPQCNGRGKLASTSYKKYTPYCSVCGGSGEKERKYRCPIRLISDNSDFHYRKGWDRLLHNDLVSLIDLAS